MIQTTTRATADNAEPTLEEAFEAAIGPEEGTGIAILPTTTEESVPTWGIRYLLFGDSKELSESDRTAADRWAAGLDPRAEIVPEGRTYLSLRPAFGWHATHCRNCRIQLP